MSETRTVELGRIEVESVESAAINLGYTTKIVNNILTVSGVGLYRDMVFTVDEIGKVAVSYDDMNTPKYAELIVEYGEIVIKKRASNRFISLGKTKTKDAIILTLKRR